MYRCEDDCEAEAKSLHNIASKARSPAAPQHSVWPVKLHLRQEWIDEATKNAQRHRTTSCHGR
jgi:hypothetical protein